MANIESALLKLFEKNRIVFWYDAKRELRDVFESLMLPGIEQIELKNNEFGVKYRMLRERPKQSFLLYHEGPQPPDLENWLLDVLLAEGEFRADQISLWLSELGLGPEFWEVVQEHVGFFQDAGRRAQLKARLEKGDRPNAVRRKMLAVCAGGGTAPRLDEILESLLDELAQEQDERIQIIEHSHLATFLWERVQRAYGYSPKTATVRDFAITLFKSGYQLGLGESAALNSEAQVFLRRWKDSVQHQAAFEALSGEYAKILNIESDLTKHSVQSLVDLDYFKLIDLRILSDLARQISNRTLPAAPCAAIIHRRRTTHWYGEHRHLYEAIYFGSQFLTELDRAELSVLSLVDGIQKYTGTWYRLDQLYRKFIYHQRASHQVSVLEDLVRLVENKYTNQFLLKVNDNWQVYVDASQTWDLRPFGMQKDFFNEQVKRYLRDKIKVAVIISDGLRYELGAELAERVARENRYTAEVEALIATLPSYTQLGMAALLPQADLTISKDGTVLVGEQSTAGLDNRSKLLNEAVAGEATAVRADDFRKMNRDENRALFRENQVVYLYHNQVDLVGDKRESEEQVFEAAETALADLVDLVKKLAGANFTHILITSDHGFLYQNQALDESDFAGLEVYGDEILYRDRRFVLGHGLQASPSVKKFTAGQLGLGGDLEVVLPKSINRLRLRGAGSRYVHGGASLQEVVIPLVHVQKKRESDLGQVEVDILRGSSSVISTGQLNVAFYQDQPVSPKLRERRLRAGIYTQDGELISDRHELNFDLDAENPRQREIQVRFILSRAAEKANEQEVFLKLEEKVPDTEHYREYKSVRYILRRSFTSDFDF